ncbi:GvpL/GvpF family gas vesicle protein [Thermoleophilia bacterium SCSIO 60948]|nr:GvpL/GvpF family gas vesicle protein [Thermoleophilia bacterium SCSIO 60948]
MPGSDPSFDALREAIAALADRHAGELVEEAEAQARERVRASLTDAIADALFERSAAELAARHIDVAASGRSAAGPAHRSPPETAGDRRPAERAAPARHEGALQEEPAAPAPGDPAAATGGGEATYVFGIAEATDRLGDLPGFEPHRGVRPIALGSLSAIVTTVDLAEFGEQALQQNLEDLEWIERTARTHETVLGALAQQTAVVPMRLCTIYRDDGQVATMLTERGEEFAATLGRLRGRTEWGVKLIAEPGALEEIARGRGGGEESAEAGLSPGLAYLDRKQREQRARGDVETTAAEIAGDAHARLAATSAAARLNKLQARELGGHSGDMILNGAYLVDDGDFDRFEGALEALRDELGTDAIAAELTGPWPAYNFASAEDDEVLRVAG